MPQFGKKFSYLFVAARFGLMQESTALSTAGEHISLGRFDLDHTWLSVFVFRLYIMTHSTR